MSSSAAAGATSSGTPSPVVLYQERLWPALWLWLFTLGLSAGGALALAPINITASITAAVVLLIVSSAVLILTTPLIRVTDTHVSVGRASIERRYLGHVQAFEGEQAFAQRGRELNATAYQCIRGWVPAVVRLEIVDPQDPTPYWLTSTRHPARLSAALRH